MIDYMRKLYLLACLLPVVSLQAQNITLTPAIAELEGEPDIIHEVHIELHNAGETQTMTWKRTINDIPDYWTSSVCDFTLCWSPNADAPGDYFEAPADTMGSVFVKFDARNFKDGVYNPVPGCGTVEVVFYSVLDSANYNAVGLFKAFLGTTSDDCDVAIISPELDNSFAVYPNPAINTINNYASKSAFVQQVSIVNLVGHEVARFDWNTANGKMELDVTDLTQGIYFVRLVDGSSQVVWTEKLSILQ